MKIKRDQLTGLALILCGVFFGVLTSRFKTPFTAAYPGPKLLPMIGVVGLVVCGLGIFISSCMQKTEEKVFLGQVGWKRVIISFLILCVYVLGMKYLGFLITTPIILFLITSYFSKSSDIETKLWVRIVFSVVVSVIIWAMYVPLFGMTLPSGMLFG